MVADQPTPTAITPLTGVVEDLAYRFDGVFSRQTVERYVRESYGLLAENATVTGFLPVLAARFARERLLAAARTEGLRASRTPEVLFICVQNAGRSQMAAAWLHGLSGGRVHVRSAGSLPGSAVGDVAFVDGKGTLAGGKVYPGNRFFPSSDFMYCVHYLRSFKLMAFGF